MCRCLVSDCPFNKKQTLCQRKEFYFHVSKLTTDKIIELLYDLDVAKYLHVLNRRTLLNLLTDLSIEPTATQILDESRHEKPDFS